MRQPTPPIAEARITCPRCLRTIPGRLKPVFCPHCGLRDVIGAARREPIQLRSPRGIYTIRETVGYGDLCNLYRCEFGSPPHHRSAIFKIGRDGRSNHLLHAEAHALRRLAENSDHARFAPFLPTLTDTLEIGESGAAEQRVGNVLTFEVQPAELYTLAEVRRYFPSGLDPRDMAWIWRRLLNVMVFVHQCGVSHNAVLPSHVLIEPREHKLVLVGWCAAHCQGPPGRPRTMSGSYANWYRSSTLTGPATDVALGARTMIELLGGSGAAATPPASLDPALRRYFERCIDPSFASGTGRLLEDFDRLIEVLWGARQFRPLHLPPRY